MVSIVRQEEKKRSIRSLSRVYYVSSSSSLPKRLRSATIVGWLRSPVSAISCSGSVSGARSTYVTRYIGARGDRSSSGGDNDGSWRAVR